MAVIVRVVEPPTAPGNPPRTRILRVQAKPGQTVLDLKSDLSVETGYSLDRLELVKGGKILEASTPLKSLCTHPGHQFHIVLLVEDEQRRQAYEAQLKFEENAKSSPQPLAVMPSAQPSANRRVVRQLPFSEAMGLLERMIPPQARQQLLEMGFIESRVVKALLLNRMDPRVAMEWLLRHSDDSHVDDPLSAQQIYALLSSFYRSASAPRVHASLGPAMAWTLNNNVCTFSATQRRFAQQRFRCCLTCNIQDGRGVCLSCANVCHQGHQLSETQYSESFFCDCGSGDGPAPCRALQQLPEQFASAAAMTMQAAPPPFSMPVSSPSVARMSSSSQPPSLDLLGVARAPDASSPGLLDAALANRNPFLIVDRSLRQFGESLGCGASLAPLRSNLSSQELHALCDLIAIVAAAESNAAITDELFAIVPILLNLLDSHADLICGLLSGIMRFPQAIEAAARHTSMASLASRLLSYCPRAGSGDDHTENRMSLCRNIMAYFINTAAASFHSRVPSARAYGIDRACDIVEQICVPRVQQQGQVMTGYFAVELMSNYSLLARDMMENDQNRLLRAFIQVLGRTNDASIALKLLMSLGTMLIEVPRLKALAQQEGAVPVLARVQNLPDIRLQQFAVRMRQMVQR